MKRFYNNTKMSGSFSKALRVVALLCVLLGFSSSMFGNTYYIDASCISGVQQISWLQATGGNTSGDLIPQNTTFDGKSAFQFEANSGTTVRMQLKISSNGQVKYPAIHNISLSTSNCIELSYDGNNLGHTMKTYSTLKCAGGCTPAGTITDATYDGSKVVLTGNITELCTNTSVTYGFDYSTDAKNWYNISTTTKSSTGTVSQEWTTGFTKGTTYYFRLSINSTTDNNTKSLTIPSSSSTQTNCDKIIYLNPGVWKQGEERFAAYFSNGSSNDVWVNMTATTSCDGLYYVEIPEGGYAKVQFGRMNPDRNDNSFVHNDQNGPMYNISNIQDIPTDDNITLSIGNNWDNSGNIWISTTCTEGCIVAGSGDLLLSSKPIVNKQNKVATVSAYLARNAGCKTITEYGFVYCTSANEEECTPDANSEKVTRDGSLIRGQEYSMNIPNLDDGLTYYYRAYILADGTPILSDEIRSFATDPCIPQECCGDNTIIYTIDATFSKDNLCKLQFRNLQTAIDHLKETSELESDNKFKYVTKSGDSYNLNQPVEMRVAYYDDDPDSDVRTNMYFGKEYDSNSDKTAGEENPKNINLIKDFNRDGANKVNTLTIKAGNSKAKPLIHHIVIRNSKNIVLDSLAIYSDQRDNNDSEEGIQTLGDNALEIDINNGNKKEGWLDHDPGYFDDANILIQNCIINSDGFTGIHVHAYDGITFKNNEFEARFESTSENDINWGASAKFMRCMNIKFIQNNFVGDHATLLWVQESQNFLVMNNVFWNTNNYYNSSYRTPTSIMLNVQKSVNVTGIDILYNTFFLEDNSKNSNWKYNFLTMRKLEYNSDGSGSINNILQDNIQFMYNNCYSYDDAVIGRDDNPFDGKDLSAHNNFCPNNFWSKYDQDKKDSGEDVTKSVFAFGCTNNKLINVKTQMCKGSVITPRSLMIKGQELNLGKKPTTLKSNITLEGKEIYADRYNLNVRPSSGDGWTYGAYQSKEATPVHTIYWVGVNDNWDDRNNWEYDVEEDGEIKRIPVSCANTFSENLKVIIEEIGTYEITGGRQWPKVPASFTENRTNSDYGEHVSAGLGTIDNPTKFADHIEVEYGAGIIGVENLNKAGDQLRYTSAATNLVAPRNQWLLVGPVIKPFNEETKDIEDDVRDIVSNDYFLNHFPAVYMKGAYLTKDNEGNALAKWDASFPDLNKAVVQKSAYAIELPDEYGTEKNTASYYNATYGTSYDPTEAHPYRFNGRFYNEDSELIYTGLTKNEPVLLNNTYPANIDAYKLNYENGTVQIYNYENKSFEANPKEGSAILSQHAFVITPIANELTIDKDYFLNSSTRHRSSTIVNPNCRVEVRNTKYNTASNVVVMVDEFKDDEADYSVDAPKIYNGMEKSLPDMYVMRYDKTWSGIRVTSMEEAIPLGIRINRKNTPVEFNLVSKEELGDIILEDRGEGKFYNLSEGEKCTVSDLQKGECIGRFFLYLSEPNMEEDDDNVTTEVEEEVSSENGIIIMSKENGVVVSCSSDIELKTIYINDMSGKTAMFNVSGQYAEIELPVAQGVYTVNVIGDTATKTGKVILK
ncbi:MAG: hypothetical protein IKA83_01735 [Paludibacteraceae bacterium]|nr:hypothetical protein [Paludibacteraceae bacterium]